MRTPVLVIIGVALFLVVFAGATYWLVRPNAPPAVGLSVGDLAPEIEGEDIYGRPFRLSEFRGNVVVLDFWGSA